jgi:hypothetical protein
MTLCSTTELTYCECAAIMEAFCSEQSVHLSEFMILLMILNGSVGMKIIPLNGDVIVNLVNNQNGMFFSLQ